MFFAWNRSEDDLIITILNMKFKTIVFLYNIVMAIVAGVAAAIILNCYFLIVHAL